MQFFKINKLLFLIFIVIITTFSCRNPDVKTESEYISEVFEYVYAPGQHANLAKKSDIQYFIGNPDEHQGWLYLGGFGGYVIAGFDHSIENHKGADFEVYLLKGASPEPAVVYVMQDVNRDGKPNETWYELKGNQFENSKHNYWLTYYKAKSDSANITWLDSEGKRGELISGYGSNFSSGWWWNETKQDSIKFYGTKLPALYDSDLQNGNQSWTADKDKFVWGYAENNSGTDYETVLGANKLDISNAVDTEGKLVNLSEIRFIKVQTGVFQQAGWLNEISAEVRGARELK